MSLNSLTTFLLVCAVETLVRLRTALAGNPGLRLAVRLLDNLRIGLVFALVLEAFKLGS